MNISIYIEDEKYKHINLTTKYKNY